MTTDMKIKGDVGQAIAGNVTYEGAKATNSSQLSNVVNIHVAPIDSKDQTITDLQRRTIAMKAFDLERATSVSRKYIYRTILTEHGIEGIRDLPRSKFNEVSEMLDAWMAEASRPEIKSENSTPASEEFERPAIDADYVGLSMRIDRIQMRARIIAGSLTLGLASIGYAAYGGSKDYRANVCHYEGNEYSIGAVEKMSGKEKECLISESGGAEWNQKPENN